MASWRVIFKTLFLIVMRRGNGVPEEIPGTVAPFLRERSTQMHTVSDYFGSLVFDDRVMRAKLPSHVYASLKRTIDEGASLDAHVADAVATAMRDWACLLYTSPSPRDRQKSRMPSSA